MATKGKTANPTAGFYHFTPVDLFPRRRYYGSNRLMNSAARRGEIKRVLVA